MYTIYIIFFLFINSGTISLKHEKKILLYQEKTYLVSREIMKSSAKSHGTGQTYSTSIGLLFSRVQVRGFDS